MSKDYEGVNRCDRCDRPLSDPTANYGWRCAQIVGFGNYSRKVAALDNASLRLYNAYVDKYLSKDKKGRTGNFATTGQNYKSSFVERVDKDDIKYTVITDIDILGKNYQAEFDITNDGTVRIDFDVNEYAEILSHGGSDILAKAIYDGTREVFPDSMSGRTVNGISRELQLHYAAYRLNILKDNANPADIGGMDKDGLDYDSNAVLFEAIDIAEDILLEPKRNRGIIEEIWRYVR